VPLQPLTLSAAYGPPLEKNHVAAPDCNSGGWSLSSYIFNAFARIATLFDFVVAYNGSKLHTETGKVCYGRLIVVGTRAKTQSRWRCQWLGMCLLAAVCSTLAKETGIVAFALCLLTDADVVRLILPPRSSLRFSVRVH